MNNLRPKSLAEIAVRAADLDQFQMELKDFMHELRASASPESIRQTPPLLAGKIAGGEKVDAYLAACALFLARQHAWDIPEWVHEQSRFLRHPWFLLPGAKIRNLLLMESPAEFRERNIFVSANALEAV